MTAVNVAFPFRTIPHHLVKCSPWMLYETDEILPLLETIEHWDYDTEINFRRSVTLDLADCLRQSGLDQKQTNLQIIVMVVTGPTSSRWVAYQKDINNSHKGIINISFDVESENLAGAITLVTELVLVEPGEKSEILSASKPGSRLWTDIHKIDIEGTSARFPMDILDFDKSLSSLDISSSPWYLQWNAEHLESSFVGNVVLYINSGQESFLEKVQKEDPAVMTWLRVDLIRQMCSVALDQDEFIENYSGYQEGSIGGTINNWLTIAFENLGIETIRSLYRTQRSRFESMIASVYGGEDV